MSEAVAVRDIEVSVEETPENNELSTEYTFLCNFCQRRLKTSITYGGIYERLVRKSSGFYCPNCIRNGFYTKKRNDILQMTFRGIFGYIYYRCYVSEGFSKEKTSVFLAEIQDAIDAHARTGLLNPAFSYDPETYIWFVDFSKIGVNKNQMGIQDVYKTVVNILVCFNIAQVISNVQMHKLYDKYNEAINLFYTQRKRTEGRRRLLVPSMQGCGGTNETGFDYEKTRNFLPRDLRIHS